MPTKPTTTTRPAGPPVRCGDCGFVFATDPRTRECPNCGVALFPSRPRPQRDPDDPRMAHQEPDPRARRPQ